ncbi:uncharacterized protein LAESUDRAFT_743609 [Laetiporus sulphureus 93-53]|uniref:C3H1-type domain-containing protein n=1 Tax=Laetiporus sulphureus 93-53 TaxID=1314785 RepID=A0A165DXP7_9APHY|nr:uncharacterized protein LAESUDRAFT_743609 [Laetiporus sulphureus 93-53]KZT05834.1 hypothetical protein LAESUDRAFT_743609 [Laetiporus sulphureus 93-53]
MVSPLWKACSEGNLENVNELLKEASTADIEVNDHDGVTPLIEAVKNGHIEVVKVLLEKGADPTNASSQGPTEQFTSDSAILELLDAAKTELSSSAAPAQEPVYAHDPNVDQTKGYYGPPPSAYYYPGVPIGAPMLPDGAISYYPPPAPVASEPNGNGMPNLPPPEVARMIPCRYYPACRYGSSCIFAHPQAPYIQGPLPPPAQYPAPYDSIAPPYPPHTYYGVPQPPYPTSPNGVMSPPAGGQPLPQPPMTHTRSGSEVVSPIQAPFSPNGAPPPVPYGVMSPVSPTYAHPGQVPVPISVPPLSPLQHAGGPQSPQQSMYSPMSPVAQGLMQSYPAPLDPMAPYPLGMVPNGSISETIGSPKSPQEHLLMDGYGPRPMNRDIMTHHRRGSGRRPSFGGSGRKPPCLFFPAGKCRNGDECRFPHILPDASFQYHPAHHPPHFSGRGGHRPRASSHMNGVPGIEEKIANMSVQEQDGQPAQPRAGANGVDATANSSRSQSSDGVNRRGPQNFKAGPYANGARVDKKFIPPKSQRVPSADEFPTLTNTAPPPRSPGLHGPGSGPTAAQILQAPPPRKDGQSTTRGSSPEQNGSQDQNAKENKADSDAPTPDPSANKLPISFAAAATAVPDTAAKEVSVTA